MQARILFGGFVDDHEVEVSRHHLFIISVQRCHDARIVSRLSQTDSNLSKERQSLLITTASALDYGRLLCCVGSIHIVNALFLAVHSNEKDFGR